MGKPVDKRDDDTPSMARTVRGSWAAIGLPAEPIGTRRRPMPHHQLVSPVDTELIKRRTRRSHRSVRRHPIRPAPNPA